MNIIIPAAGLGQRFIEDGYLMPKPLINVLGEPMIFYVIRNLKLTPADKIYIIYTWELEKYSFQDILQKAFHTLDLNFTVLDFNTRGPAETVLCGMDRLTDLDEKVLVLDCDTFYREDILGTFREQYDNCIFYFEDHSTEPIFSYIKIGSDNKVSEIKEKVRISNNACTGAYGFRSGGLLKEYCKSVLMNYGAKSNNEYYLSSVYAQMLQEGETIVAQRVEDFTCLGTPQLLKEYSLSNGTGKGIEPRNFNNISYGNHYVIKTTDNPGEIYWYQNIPSSIKEHFPHMVTKVGKIIVMEKVNGIVFNYLLVNGSLTKDNIENLLNTIQKIHNSQEGNTNVDYSANYNPKIIERYNTFDYSSVSDDAAYYFARITERLAGHIPVIGVIHGDPVFSNIFLCDNQLIKFIDMRGRVGEVETIFGDIFYDYAKIYQSLYGYDFILNDREINETYLRELREYFEKTFMERFSVEQLETLKYITAGLLFSLIPLHTDLGKQQKYFALIKEII